MFMLDTDICIYTIKQNPPQVYERLRKTSTDHACISVITYAELMRGAYKSQQREKNIDGLKTFVERVRIIPFDSHAGEIYGKIRSDLEKSGQIIGSFDLLIAAHALSEKMVLVTHNTKEFKRIKDLKIEDWT